MKKKIRMIIVVFFITTLAVPAFAKVFKTSDLAGNWYTYGKEINPSIPAVYWLWGNIDIDESGNLTGTYYAPDGSSVTLESGQLSIDYKGVMSGGFTAEGDTATVVNGKLDEGKTFGTAVLVGTDGTMDLVTNIKGGGTFVPSDIQDSWYTYVTAIDATTGAVYSAYGTVDVDDSGKVTGLFNAPDGSTVSVTDGEMVLSDEGIITGSTTLSTGDTSLIVHGKLDQAKTFGMYVSVSPDDGSMRTGYLYKAGGTFKKTDIAGNWYVYTLIIDPTIPAVYWAYGKAGIDALGNFTGSYNGPTGQSINLTGTLQMNNEGLGTGTVKFQTGDTGVLSSIKLDQSKTSMTGVGIITEGSTVGSMTILQFIKESNIPMPGIPLLLLDE
jgi:hypothetical protein